MVLVIIILRIIIKNIQNDKTETIMMNQYKIYKKKIIKNVIKKKEAASDSVLFEYIYIYKTTNREIK